MRAGRAPRQRRRRAKRVAGTGAPGARAVPERTAAREQQARVLGARGTPERHGRAGREAAALGGRAACVVTAAEELHRVGDDLDALALVAVLALPLAPLETAVEGNGAALGEEPGAVLALGAPDRDVEEVRLVLPLTGRVVLASRVAGDAQRAHRR